MRVLRRRIDSYTTLVVCDGAVAVAIVHSLNHSTNLGHSNGDVAGPGAAQRRQPDGIRDPVRVCQHREGQGINGEVSALFAAIGWAWRRFRNSFTGGDR